jgi:hypothetical protein
MKKTIFRENKNEELIEQNYDELEDAIEELDS